MAFYAAITAAVLTFLAQTSSPNPRPLLVFLMVLSLFIGLLTSRTWANLLFIQQRLESLARTVGLPDYYVTTAAAGYHVPPGWGGRFSGRL